MTIDDETRERLRRRYEPEPVPPCPVCGAERVLARAYDNGDEEWCCPRWRGGLAEATDRLRAGDLALDDYHHAIKAFWIRLPGDADVLALLAALEDAERAVGEAYTDRNLLVQVAARQALEQGEAVWLAPGEDPEWPVLFFYSGGYQMSYHLPKGEVCGPWPQPPERLPGGDPARWDGHTTEQKRARQRLLLHRPRRYVRRG